MKNRSQQVEIKPTAKKLPSATLILRKYDLTNVNVVIVETELHNEIGILEENGGHVVTIYLKTDEENN